MTCQDCVHYEVCEVTYPDLDLPFVNLEKCRLFKDKSKFIELPCEVGDTVYVICGFVSEYKVQQIIYDGIFLWADLLNEKYAIPDNTATRCISFDLGKTIFLTKEEAEQALKGRGGNVL